MEVFTTWVLVSPLAVKKTFGHSKNNAIFEYVQLMLKDFFLIGHEFINSESFELVRSETAKFDRILDTLRCDIFNDAWVVISRLKHLLNNFDDAVFDTSESKVKTIHRCLMKKFESGEIDDAVIKQHPYIPDILDQTLKIITNEGRTVFFDLQALTSELPSREFLFKAKKNLCLVEVKSVIY